MSALKLRDEASVSGARRLIRSELVQVGAPPTDAFDCLVAVTEACTNALLHGRTPRGPDPEVEWEIGSKRAEFVIRDPGGPNDQDRSTPAEIRDGGYGLKMIRRLMDEVDIRFGADGGTTVLLVKYFSN
jgi:serine/threonine-protein kinase RsbW